MKIDKGIPVPARHNRYPWDRMKIGDSFFVKNADKHNVSSAASLRGRHYGEKYTCRSIDGGVRVWRIA